MVHLHSSLLFVPDVSFNTFSSFRSTPNNYLFSTERWFTASACSATVIDLLSSFIQHSLLLQISNDSRHTLPFCKNKCAKLWDSKNGFVEADKTVLFLHIGLLSLVRSKCEVLCLTLKFDFSVGWLQVTFWSYQ